MTTQAFEFDGPTGYKLSGRLEKPDTALAGWAILAHCFTCGKDSLAASRIARALALRGIGVLRFDFAGLGTSGGSFADSTFAADVEDLVAAGQAMAAAGKEPSLLLGHSLGGAAALAGATALPAARGIVTIGAPFDLMHILAHVDPSGLQAIETIGEAEVLLAGRPFVVRKTFVDDLSQHDLGARIAGLRRPLLVMHAPGDTTVPIDHATRIFMAAWHPKSFVSLDDADHLLTRRSDADYVAAVIAAWASRYLSATQS